MKNKKATIKRTDIGTYELEVEVNKTYTITSVNDKITIEEINGTKQ